MIKFHFLNVGHGDTTIVELPDDYLMVVDFNRSNELDEDTAKELSDIYGIDFVGLKKKKIVIINTYQNIMISPLMIP